VWYIITVILELVPPLFLPSPIEILHTFYMLFKEGYREISIFNHILLSLMRVLGAFLIACLIGIPLGILMAMNRTIEGMFDPLIELYRPVPPIAMIPLFIIWLGIGEMSKIGIIFISIFAVIVINTISGVKAITQTKIWAAQSLGADKWKLFWHIIFPGALPHILTGMRVGTGFGWTTLVASEMIAAASGIGWMTLNARRFLRTDIIICGVIIMGIIGFLLDRGLRVLEARAVPWKGKE
ncbi:MAG: ABC transporter permease subunit, partial [Desulfobacteraceae bacterium]|nr:ABC transporter permease subunit [Desulfobacteraceae bacterium]